jgi:hypothetical protein
MNLLSQTRETGDSPGFPAIHIRDPLLLGSFFDFAPILSVVDTCMSVSCDIYRAIGTHLSPALRTHPE